MYWNILMSTSTPGSPGSSDSSNGDTPTVEIRTIAGVHVIHFTRHISNRLVVGQMNQKVQALLEQEDNQPRFVIDFSDVHEISSAILGVLMGIHMRICKKQGELRLSGLRRELLNVIMLMKLDMILNIDATLDESLARMSD